jgi:hypothetical protein
MMHKGCDTLVQFKHLVRKIVFYFNGEMKLVEDLVAIPPITTIFRFQTMSGTLRTRSPIGLAGFLLPYAVLRGTSMPPGIGALSA